MKNCEKDHAGRGNSLGKGTEAGNGHGSQDCQKRDGVRAGAGAGAVHPGPGRKGWPCLKGVY